MKLLPLFAVMLGFGSAGLGMSAVLANHPIGNSRLPSSHNNLVSQATASTPEFIARGNEPFWNVTVNRSGIVYSTPEIRNRRYPYTAPLTAMGRPTDLVRVYRLNGQPSGMLVIKKVNSCSDGMSDIVYPYDATLILGNRVMQGCAQRR